MEIGEHFTRKFRMNTGKNKQDIIMFWDENKQLHNESGPAILFPGGGMSWFIHGIQYTKEEFIDIMLIKKLEILQKE